MITRIKIKLRNIKYWFQKRIRGWSDDETWCLDYEFVKWLNVRLKAFKKDAGKVVDLEFHKIKFCKKEKTLFQIVNRMIFLSDKMLVQYKNWDFQDQNVVENTKNELLELFRISFFYLGW